MTQLNRKLLLPLGTILLFCLSPLSAMAQDDFIVPLRPGNHIRWIDRIDLTQAVDDLGLNYAQILYETLVEGLNPQSPAPYLINPTTASHYTSQTGTPTDYYYIPVASFHDYNDTIEAKLKKACIYLHTIYEAFTRDYPEAFWLVDESCLIDRWNPETNLQEIHFVLSEVASSEGELFDIRQELYRSASTLEAAIHARDQYIQAITAPIAHERSRYRQIKYLNHWLTHHNCYYTGNLETIDPDAHPGPFRCLNALRGSTGLDGPVCEGYANAFKVLCDTLQIPCVLVEGSTRYGPHIWNYVQMEDNNWYGVDVTLNDPLIKNCTLPVSGYEHEKYLLIGSQTKPDRITPFGESHLADNMVSIEPNTTAFVNGPTLSLHQYAPTV